MFDEKLAEQLRIERSEATSFWHEYRDSTKSHEELKRHLNNSQSQIALVEMFEDMTADEIASYFILSMTELLGE